MGHPDFWGHFDIHTYLVTFKQSRKKYWVIGVIDLPASFLWLRAGEGCLFQKITLLFKNKKLRVIFKGHYQNFLLHIK